MLNGDPAGTAAPAVLGIRALDLPARVRMAMVAMGCIPAILAASSLAPVILVGAGRAAWPVALLAPAILYLVPPLAVRLLLAWRPLPSGCAELTSPDFLCWWWTAQWQIVFLRLPQLEELLRIVPGLYSLWLRLWGARVGSLVYWSPGVTILDRPLIRVGSRVVFGMGVRVNPHVIAPLPDGRVGLHLGPVTVEDDALVGGYSLLLPGCTIGAGAVTPPLRSIHAFTRWERGG
jgi:hypothetical protein